MSTSLLDCYPGPAEPMQTEPVANTALRRARLAALNGRSGVAPFAAAAGLEVVELAGGLALVGYARHRRWAITAGDVLAPQPLLGDALREYLSVLAERRLRPVFVAIADPTPYRALGMAVQPVAEEAVIDLDRFSLAGAPRAGIHPGRQRAARRSGCSAIRAVAGRRTRRRVASLVGDQARR